MVLYHGLRFCVGVESVITSNCFGCTAATAPVKSTEATFWIIVPRTMVLLVDVVDSCDDSYGVVKCLGGEAVYDVAACCWPVASKTCRRFTLGRLF